AGGSRSLHRRRARLVSAGLGRLQRAAGGKGVDAVARALHESPRLGVTKLRSGWCSVEDANLISTRRPALLQAGLKARATSSRSAAMGEPRSIGKPLVIACGLAAGLSVAVAAA